MTSDIICRPLYILSPGFPAPAALPLKRAGDPAQKAVQLSKQKKFMAPAQHLTAGHLLDTALQLLRDIAAKGPVLLPQAAAAQIFRRAASGEAHPNELPGLLLVSPNGDHFPGRNQEALSRADSAVRVPELILPPALQTEVKHIVLPYRWTGQLPRAAVLPPAEQKGQFSVSVDVLCEPGFFHPAPPL